MKINASISERISALRTLLILSVVFLHVTSVPSVANLDFSDMGAVLRCIFEDRFGRFAVPTLAMISGYLLYAAELDLTPAKLYKKKYITLVVPFFFFNIAFFAIQYLIELSTGWAPLYNYAGISLPVAIDGLLSYSTYPFNGTLHFLRDLFVLALLAPVFGLFIRNAPWAGLALVCAVFLPNFDGHLVNRNTMAVLFYLGGMAATGRWDVRKYDHFWVSAVLGLVALCALTVFYRVESFTLIYLISPPLVWIAAAGLSGSRVGAWAAANSKYSFFIFLAHGPMLRVATLAQAKFFPHLPPLAMALGTMVVVTAVLCALYECAMALMPNAFNMMIGARAMPVRVGVRGSPAPAQRPAFVERRKAPRPANAPVYTEAFRMGLAAMHEAAMAEACDADMATLA